jgi:tetratricopeptide (TPR) repeat protein
MNEKTPDDSLQDLIAVTIDTMPDSEALDHAGLLIDASSDRQSSPGTDRAFELLDNLQRRELSPELAVLAHYFRANAWAARALIESRDIWTWEQPEYQEQILALRRAVTHEAFKHLPKIRRCQILTNLANQFSQIGRFIDAVETWDRALELNPKFGIACGNRGVALIHYAHALYDRGQGSFMLLAAHDALTAACAEDALFESEGYEAIRTSFEKERAALADPKDVDAYRKHIESHKYSLGRSAAEKRYRNWCLHNRLFVNPLNDLAPAPVAAHDVLTLPSLRVPATDRPTGPPPIIGFFNQMKQEFASARYLYYEGVNAGRVHFSDRDVLLYNTLDYPAYSLAVEKMRAAFRIAYSLFDKIGVFLNDYLALGIKPRVVSFRSLWYQTKGPQPRPLLERFAAYENWPLRGLYWLSKDLFEDEFRNITEPDAAALKEIRHHLEHRYLQLHEGFSLAEPEAVSPDGAPENLAYHLSTDDFAAKTLRLLKLARAALVYLSLAVHAEERLRTLGRNADRPVLPIALDIWRDDWKQ